MGVYSTLELKLSWGSLGVVSMLNLVESLS